MHYSFKQRERNGLHEVFDPVRRKWLILTPEERVRQVFILYLLNVKQIPLSHLSVERTITVNGLTKRYDLVVFNMEKRPEIVIECKAPEVALTQAVIEQAGRYNKALHAKILGITNGLEKFFFTIDFETEVIQPIDF